MWQPDSDSSQTSTWGAKGKRGKRSRQGYDNRSAPATTPHMKKQTKNKEKDHGASWSAPGRRHATTTSQEASAHRRRLSIMHNSPGEGTPSTAARSTPMLSTREVRMLSGGKAHTHTHTHTHTPVATAELLKHKSVTDQGSKGRGKHSFVTRQLPGWTPPRTTGPTVLSLPDPVLGATRPGEGRTSRRRSDHDAKRVGATVS